MRVSSSLVVLLAVLQGGCAGLEPTAARVDVPESLNPGTNERLELVVPARGVQIYECRARKDQPGAYEWMFVAPEADLYDRGGRHIGRHYGGPHWEAADGSRIVGEVRGRADAPAAGAIPWLLLRAKSVGPQGAFSDVASIQRVNTMGGVAPRDGCAPATAGTLARIRYTADYYFYAAR